MKQFEPKDVTIEGHNFHIFPFPAFKAANLSGELAKLALPLVALLTSNTTGTGENPLDVDIEKIAPDLSGAFDSISGDKVELLLKKLLVQNKNISVDTDDGGAQYLTEDLANEIFCCDMLGMYKLAFEVIRFNFGGFFKKLGNQSGSVVEKVSTALKTATETTEN